MASERLLRTGEPPNIGIVHFGPGAFFRAFNAIYTHDAMAVAGGNWGIAAVSLKSAGAREQLQPQGGVYTAVERGPSGEKRQVITSIADVLVAPEDPGMVLDLLADPNVKVVSLTITEKGYGYDPAKGGLDPKHPDIAADLADHSKPRSAVGFIVNALRARRKVGLAPFTVMSCDNLPSNGAVAKAVVLDFARQATPELAGWIEETCAFPSTMVDRITPATTPEDIAHLLAETGYEDRAMVAHEPFRQWVIEDDFTDGRPAWELAGAQFVRSVAAHEAMKLRCLNGTHSSLAYLGYLAGYETIAETVGDGDFAAFCECLWRDEIVPTVSVPDGEDLKAYTAALMARYRNANIQHRTWQIAMDGSQKLPQRILDTVQDRLAQGQVPQGLCLAVAAWMRYVGGVDEAGAPIDVRDPLADALREASASGADAEAKVRALLEFRQIFPDKLAGNPDFLKAVVSAYRMLQSQGSAASVRNCLSNGRPG